MKTYTSFLSKYGHMIDIHRGSKGTEVLVEVAKGQLKDRQSRITKLQTGYFSWSGAFTYVCSLGQATLRTH